MNNPPSPEQTASRLAALAHPARLSILRQLGEQRCCCCRDVVANMGLAQSTVSQHLKVLVDAGLIRLEPDRQRSLYSLDRDAVDELLSEVGVLLRHCCASA